MRLFLSFSPEYEQNFSRWMVKYLQDYALHEYLSITPPKSGLLALHTVNRYNVR